MTDADFDRLRPVWDFPELVEILQKHGKLGRPPLPEAERKQRVTLHLDPDVLAALIARGWQLGPSRILPPSCRYAPSCSQYAIEALGKYGAIKGGWMAAKRIMRCHPWGGHGHDDWHVRTLRNTTRCIGPIGLGQNHLVPQVGGDG